MSGQGESTREWCCRHKPMSAWRDAIPRSRCRGCGMRGTSVVVNRPNRVKGPDISVCRYGDWNVSLGHADIGPGWPLLLFLYLLRISLLSLPSIVPTLRYPGLYPRHEYSVCQLLIMWVPLLGSRQYFADIVNRALNTMYFSFLCARRLALS